MMYLSRSISFRGERHDMVGVMPADAVMGERPQGRGLVRVEETRISHGQASPVRRPSRRTNSITRAWKMSRQTCATRGA